MRCSLTLAYNGTSYLGSQTQTQTSNTILGQLQIVLKKLGIDERVIASGRTDKGVHATAQVCHLDLPKHWVDLVKLQRVLNSMLPTSIQVRAIKEVDDDFHARYSAKRRVYRYIIKKSDSNPFESDFIAFYKDANFNSIAQNIKLFIGEHDFAYFMKSGSDINSTIRTIYTAYAYKHNGLIILRFEANGFLRAQIRLMVGALLKLNAEEIQAQLLLKKKHNIKLADCNGLYLSKINY
jgi:tRNA pseudouridine38-40 synthase